MKFLIGLTLAIAIASAGAACGRDADAMTAQRIEDQYGLSGAFEDTIATPDGPMKGTLVPITLANGGEGHLFIPTRQASDVQAVYLQDGLGLHPIELGANTTRADVSRAPAIVRAPQAAQPAARSANGRSWEQEVLIVSASAGAGAAIGALASGKKGAGVGAAAGGVGGLIYDLATRKKR